MKNSIQAILDGDLEPKEKLQAIQDEIKLWTTNHELIEHMKGLVLTKPSTDPHPGSQVQRYSPEGKRLQYLRKGEASEMISPYFVSDYGKMLKHTNEHAFMYRLLPDHQPGQVVSFKFGELILKGTILSKMDHRYLIEANGIQHQVPKHEIQTV
jgi:hypothetical protein